MPYARVLNATVRILHRNGQGVLIPGAFVVTAAQCISWNVSSPPAARSCVIETIATSGGREVRARVLFADPISDMAVLGALDDHEFPTEADDFRDWSRHTWAVPLSRRAPHKTRAMRAHIFCQDQAWIPARATYSGHDPSGTAFIETMRENRGATPGTPVVDVKGSLIGLVSHLTEQRNCASSKGSISIAWRALPEWLMLRLRTRTSGQM